MTWSIKTKIPQEEEQKILTPDGEDILVGPIENEVLTYADAISFWELPDKGEESDWELKVKIDRH